MYLSVWLFGKPDWELEKITSSHELRDLGDSLKERLYRAADNYDKLVGDGWEADLHLYDVGFYKEEPPKDIGEYLKALGVEEVDIFGEEEDEEEDSL